MSSESWKDWVIEQRQEYSQRKKLARHTRESVSTSLAWPTASVAGCVEGGVAKNVEMTPSGFKATRENGTSYGAKLRDSVIHHEKNWSTPTVMDTANIQQPRKKNPTGGQKPPLCQEVNQSQNWPTATTRDWKDTTATVPPSRANLSKQTLGQRVAHVGLQDQAKLNEIGKNQGSWATPQARDWKGAEGRAYKGQTKDLPSQTKAAGKLNPNWVEQLMGLPTGWTQLPTEWID